MKPFPTVPIEARILRYLLRQGEPCDFTEIRFDGGVTKFSRERIWSAIRALISAGWVSYAYRVEQTNYEGFEQSMSYPVFWVNRSDVVQGADPLLPVARNWWADYMTALRGKGVSR